MHEFRDRFLTKHILSALQSFHDELLVGFSWRCNHNAIDSFVCKNHIRIFAVDQFSWSQIPVFAQIVPFAAVVLYNVDQVHSRIFHQIGKMEGALKKRELLLFHFHL